MDKGEIEKMIGQTISHYKIIEKLGEIPKSPTSVFSPEGMASPRVVVILIPLCGTPFFGGSGKIQL